MEDATIVPMETKTETPKVTMEDIEQYERARHLLAILSDVLKLENPSWVALSEAYMELGRHCGIVPIAEQIAEENLRKDG